MKDIDQHVRQTSVWFIVRQYVSVLISNDPINHPNIDVTGTTLSTVLCLSFSISPFCATLARTIQTDQHAHFMLQFNHFRSTYHHRVSRRGFVLAVVCGSRNTLPGQDNCIKQRSALPLSLIVPILPLDCPTRSLPISVDVLYRRRMNNSNPTARTEDERHTAAKMFHLPGGVRKPSAPRATDVSHS